MLTGRYIWDKVISQWVPEDKTRGLQRLKGISATPPTRIIPDDELPYGAHPISYDSEDEDDFLPSPANVRSNYHHLSPLNDSPYPSSIAIQELPADRMDSADIGSGNIFKAFWDLLTLYWKN
jgi:hypothetical protein